MFHVLPLRQHHFVENYTVDIHWGNGRFNTATITVGKNATSAFDLAYGGKKTQVNLCSGSSKTVQRADFN